MAIVPRRSALYMPGANTRALEKAKTLPADCLILDLEDSVAPDAKATARDQIKAAIADGGFPGREVVIRVNGVGTSWLGDDLAMAATASPDAVLVPKVSNREDVDAIRAAMAEAGVAGGVPVWAMIETAEAILKLPELVAASPSDRHAVTCFVVGANDLVKETRMQLDASRSQAQYWLAAIVTAARAGGIDVLDSVYNDFRDIEGFKAECAAGRDLGMDGKTLIHPGQIEIANETFRPGDDAVADARAILDAFSRPESKGLGVINMEGRMVERLHAEMAERTVAIADAIASKSS
ncbi:MAG: CoA ester lyase [Pseudomonadota bacterium]